MDMLCLILQCTIPFTKKNSWWNSSKIILIKRIFLFMLTKIFSFTAVVLPDFSFYKINTPKKVIFTNTMIGSIGPMVYTPLLQLMMNKKRWLLLARLLTLQ